MRLSNVNTLTVSEMETSQQPKDSQAAKEQEKIGESEHPEGGEGGSPDVASDSTTSNSQSATLATVKKAPQKPEASSSWAPMDRELAHQKIREQSRLLKKQQRTIKFLKNEMARLQRKLHAMEQSQQQDGQSASTGGQQPIDFYSVGRSLSSGENPPSKKLKRDMEDTFEYQSAHDSYHHDPMMIPIPIEISPNVAAAYPNNRNEQQQEEFPNTFRVRNQSIVDPYGDTGMYSGSISNTTALPHGRGRMVYADGQRVYKGGWNNGRWHGVGKAIFVNGDTYIGDYHMDQRHGTGRYSWSDGRLYEGEFNADKRHGKGMFQWPDGARYEGEFVNGFREGHGTYLFSGGCKYTGEWKDGRYNGIGTCMWIDGRCYSGGWREGMRHGRGVETEEDGTVRHDGEWSDDEPVLTEAERKDAGPRWSSPNHGWSRSTSNRENESRAEPYPI